MVWGASVMAGVLTVAVIVRLVAGVLKPVGVPDRDLRRPGGAGNELTFVAKVSLPLNVTGLPEIVPTLEPPV